MRRRKASKLLRIAVATLKTLRLRVRILLAAGNYTEHRSLYQVRVEWR